MTLYNGESAENFSAAVRKVRRLTARGAFTPMALKARDKKSPIAATRPAMGDFCMICRNYKGKTPAFLPCPGQSGAYCFIWGVRLQRKKESFHSSHA